MHEGMGETRKLEKVAHIYPHGSRIANRAKEQNRETSVLRTYLIGERPPAMSFERVVFHNVHFGCTSFGQIEAVNRAVEQWTTRLSLGGTMKFV